MPLSALIVAISMLAASTNLLNYPVQQRALIEIKMDGNAPNIEAVEAQLKERVNSVQAEIALQGVKLMGPQNFGYSLSPLQGQSGYSYNGYVFYETMPAEKGDMVLAALKSKGYNAMYGQRCGGGR